MPDQALTVELDGLGRVSVAGELDIDTAEQFMDGVRSVWTDGTRPVTVDVSAVTFMDSSGLTALLDLRRSGVDVWLVNVQASMRRVLDLTGLSCLFEPPEQNRIDR